MTTPILVVARTPADLASLAGPFIGIEVPAGHPLHSACVLVVDPQHGGSADTGRCCALEAALGLTGAGRAPIPAGIFVTPRLDLDAMAAAVVLDLARRDPLALDEYPYDSPGAVLHQGVSGRLHALDRADRFAHGQWPGVRPLPSEGEIWDSTGGPADVESLAAITRLVGDAAAGKISIEQALSSVEQWLLTGDFPYSSAYLDQATEARRQAIAAADRLTVQDGIVWLDETVSGPVPPSIAYRLAPVSVVRRLDRGSIRFSVAQYAEGHLDMATLKRQLSELENHTQVVAVRDRLMVEQGLPAPQYVFDADIEALWVRQFPAGSSWGGTATICGSPMGQSSLLTMDQVLGVVRACLLG